jgi:hypothetical protein
MKFFKNLKTTLDLEIGTQKLQGRTAWDISFVKGMITRSGRIRFTVDYLKVGFQITQPKDLSKRLKIDDLQIELGNIQVL